MNMANYRHTTTTPQPSIFPEKEALQWTRQEETKNSLTRSIEEGGTQSRTEEWELCRLLPYHLAMPPKARHYARTHPL